MASDAKPASSSVFNIPNPNHGTERMRENNRSIVDRINQITPVPGLGVVADNTPNGTQFSLVDPSGFGPLGGGGAADTGGAATSGTNIDLYGAYNGVIAVFHLKQSSPPTTP